jgi:hypothetical protein
MITKSKSYFLVCIQVIHEFYKKEDSNRRLYARAGIRTRVAGVTVPHTEPEYTMQNLIILIVHLYTTRAH